MRGFVPGQNGMMRSMKTHIRPDGRHFVWDPDAGSVAEAKADLYCTVESTEVDPYLALGFETIIVRMPAPYDRETIERMPRVAELLDE